ncbi:MAG: hypothetical protein JNJ77_19035 [Planctomycetia bacterium]|nr:hypothetical protein [Planctomycetia bacterium]
MNWRIIVLSLGVLLGISMLTAGIIEYKNRRPDYYDKLEKMLTWEAENLLKDPRYAQQFIRTGPPEESYNCHGWTFARGRRALDISEVKMQLSNGPYRKVQVPESGDIVIYYDDQGEICHSGVVKATGRNGFVLVESKWGSAGRFLHMLRLPKVQAQHEFYRRSIRGPRTTIPRAEKINISPIID